MTIEFHDAVTESISLAEFHEFVQKTVNVRRLDSLCTVAPMLRRLANDRDLVVRKLNERVGELANRDAIFSSQVLMLGSGPNYYVRANIWPSTSDMAGDKVVLSDQFTYDIGHSHNYSFLTAAYSGPGYSSDLYRVDPSMIQGRVGEAVDLQFIKRMHFGQGMAMLYEADVDVHSQSSPTELTITLNFVAAPPEVHIRDQYFFDLARGTLMEFPAGLDVSRRVSIVRMAALVRNSNTVELLRDLARAHPCRRTRLAACESLVSIDPEYKSDVLEIAANDVDPSIRYLARAALR